MSATAYPFGFTNLPLLDVREEVRAFGVNPTTPVAVLYPCQWPFSQNAGQFYPQSFWSLTGGTGGAVVQLAANGQWVRRITRAAGTNAIGAGNFQLPLAYVPLTAPTVPANLLDQRRYIYEWCMWGDALLAGSVLSGGVNTNSGAIVLLPNGAFNATSSYHFRRVNTENGGLWQVASRQGFGVGALTLIPTTLDSLTPRTFRMDFQEAPTGGTLTMSIDGAVVATFSGANFPALIAGSVPQWSLSIGSEGAAGATFDYVAAPKIQIFAR